MESKKKGYQNKKSTPVDNQIGKKVFSANPYNQHQSSQRYPGWNSQFWNLNPKSFFVERYCRAPTRIVWRQSFEKCSPREGAHAESKVSRRAHIVRQNIFPNGLKKGLWLDRNKTLVYSVPVCRHLLVTSDVSIVLQAFISRFFKN